MLNKEVKTYNHCVTVAQIVLVAARREDRDEIFVGVILGWSDEPHGGAVLCKAEDY